MRRSRVLKPDVVSAESVMALGSPLCSWLADCSTVWGGI